MFAALIILDMARGYGWEPGSFGYELVAAVRRLKDAAHEAGVPVVHVTSLRRPTDGAVNQKMMVGSSNLDVIPELHPLDGDTIVYKRSLSGFSHNDLDYTLRCMGVTTVILCGASTDNTVLWTAGDAFQNGYQVVIVDECTAVLRQGAADNKDKALDIMRAVLRAEVVGLDEAIGTYMTDARRPG